PAMQMKWNSVAVPLINAAANAATPLGKVQNEERKVKNEEPTAEQTESRVEKNKDQATDRQRDQKTKSRKDEETNEQDDKKKGSVFRFFGRSVEKPESAAAGNRNQATGDRRE
ncbi:MAG: hypothetical protein ACKOEG_02200, partial [Chthoniobacterales bacterium]